MHVIIRLGQTRNEWLHAHTLRVVRCGNNQFKLGAVEQQRVGKAHTRAGVASLPCEQQKYKQKQRKQRLVYLLLPASSFLFSMA